MKSDISWGFVEGKVDDGCICCSSDEPSSEHRCSDEPGRTGHRAHIHRRVLWETDWSCQCTGQCRCTYVMLCVCGYMIQCRETSFQDCLTASWKLRPYGTINQFYIVIMFGRCWVPLPPHLHSTTSKVMVIVWRLRGNVITTILYIANVLPLQLAQLTKTVHTARLGLEFVFLFFRLHDLSLCLCVFCFTLDSWVISLHVVALA